MIWVYDIVRQEKRAGYLLRIRCIKQLYKINRGAFAQLIGISRHYAPSIASGRLSNSAGKEFITMKRKCSFGNSAELKKRIEGYFRDCRGVAECDEDGNAVYDKNGARIMKIAEKPLTVTGLANAIGFPTRRALLNFRGSERQNDIIDRALSVIEEYGESRLLDKGQFSGAKFFLVNNFAGWADSPDDGCERECVEKLDAVLGELCADMKRRGE